MGTAALRKIQYGKETVKGTAVPATKMLPATLGPIKPDSQPTFPRESAGIKADAVRAYVTGLLVQDTIKLDTAYYQALPFLFSCGLKGGVIPTEQTVGKGDFLWDFTPSLTASNSPDSATIERGDDTMMVETEYCMFNGITISGDIDQEGKNSACAIEADFFGRQNSTASFTALGPQAKLTEINAKLTRMYIDADWAGVGITEVPNTLRGFDIAISTGLHPKFFGSGNRHFDSHGEGPIGVMASFIFEGNSAMQAIWDAHKAAALQVVRLKVTGPLVAVGAKPFELVLDIGGAWDAITMLSGESNGNDLWAATLHGYADLATSKMLQVQVTSDQAVM